MSGLRIGVIVAVCAALCAAIVLPAARPSPAPQGPASLANDPKLIEDLVYANRILYQQAVLDGFAWTDKNAVAPYVFRSYGYDEGSVAYLTENEADQIQGRIDRLTPEDQEPPFFVYQMDDHDFASINRILDEHAKELEEEKQFAAERDKKAGGK